MTLTQIAISEAIETGVPIQHLLQQIDKMNITNVHERAKLKLEYYEQWTIQLKQWEIQNGKSWAKKRNS